MYSQRKITKKYLKNWHPISILIVVCKLASSGIAVRLKTFRQTIYMQYGLNMIFKGKIHKRTY